MTSHLASDVFAMDEMSLILLMHTDNRILQLVIMTAPGRLNIDS